MINRILGGLGRTLIFSGIVLLLFVGYQLWGTGLDESGHQEDLTRSLGHSLGVDTAKTDAEEEDAAAIDEKITAKLSSIDPTKAPPAEIPKEGDPDLRAERIWDAAKAGYVSGDLHFHLNYGGPYTVGPAELQQVLRADLNATKGTVDTMGRDRDAWHLSEQLAGMQR